MEVMMCDEALTRAEVCVTGLGLRPAIVIQPKAGEVNKDSIETSKEESSASDDNQVGGIHKQGPEHTPS